MKIGDRINNFTIVSELGAGGMGQVFLAEQPNIDTKVAIKVLRTEISKDQDHVQRFFNEARAVSRIKHAGIVKIFEGGFHESGHAYLIMEHLEGETLAARIRRGKLAVGALCDVGRQIASILAATHAVGITHRDLKPDNIFIVADAELATGERVKILDFGIAKLTGTLASGPGTVGTMGTPSYMAPEQWGDSANVDWRADAYSLGCVLFEMACGRPPFLGTSFADLCAKHLSTPPPTPTKIGVTLPPALEQLIMKLLVKDAAERTTPLADIGKQLAAIGQHAPISAPMPAVTPTPVEVAPTVLPTVQPSTTLREAAGERRSTKSRKGAISVGAAAVVAIGSVVAAVKLRHSDQPVEPAMPSPPPSPPPAQIDASVVEPTIDAAAGPSLRARIEAMNPFVDVNGVKLSKHQVRRVEFAMYLQSLADEDARAKAKPLIQTRAHEDTVGGLSYDRARSFCLAIDADLPSVEQWKRAAGTHWGIDAGDGMGPFQEWTSHVDGSLATVVGGHRDMTPAKQAEALQEPLLKSTEASAGTEYPDVIADLRIGFRCVSR